MATKTKTIEDNFADIEKIISSLEDSSLPLEEAFLAYEKGIKLIGECNKQLDKVEKQIIILKEQGIERDE